MASNRGVAYVKPGEVEIQSIDYPKLELGQPQVRSRSHPEDRFHQHLRQRPAHGSRTDHRSGRNHLGT